MCVKVLEKNKKYEFIPPDGGWGYIIGVAVIINTMTITAFAPCFGMIFRELLPELGMDSTSVTLMYGISAFSIAVTGLFTSPILEYLSIRQLGLIATLVFNLGVFGTVFVNSKIAFFLCMGVLQGLGNGVIYNLSTTMLNNYFVKRRLLAVSFTQTIIGVIALISPQFVKWALQKYGLRGTLLLISGVSMQSIVAMALMQPVAWHMKRVEIPEDKENEMKYLLKGENEIKGKEIISNTTEKGCLEDQSHRYNNCIKNFVSKIIDVSLLKTFLLSNVSVGIALIIFSDFTFTMMLPQALYSMGWSEDNVAWCLSLTAMGDLVTRAAFALMSKWILKAGSQEVYICGLVIGFVSRTGLLWSGNMKLTIGLITMLGISKCTLSLLVPVVVADAVGEAKFSSALGIILVLLGIFNLFLGPIVGAIRDLTDSYKIALNILGFLFGIVSLSWTTELIYKRNKYKRQSTFTKE